MREIKFRTYDSISYGMVYYDSLNDICEDAHRFIKGKYQHIMQYTGLKDKNGKEIYEGDIVKWDNVSKFRNERYEHRGVVRYSNGSYYPLPKDDECEDDYYSNYVENYEVIGNIYENPELLEVKE